MTAVLGYIIYHVRLWIKNVINRFLCRILWFCLRTETLAKKSFIRRGKKWLNRSGRFWAATRITVKPQFLNGLPSRNLHHVPGAMDGRSGKGSGQTGIQD